MIVFLERVLFYTLVSVLCLVLTGAITLGLILIWTNMPWWAAIPIIIILFSLVVGIFGAIAEQLS